MVFEKENESYNPTIEEYLEYFTRKDNQVDESIEAYLSEENIITIFYEYIIKNKIIGIDNIDNDSFRKNMALHANHISKTIKDYHYSPYLEKLISKGRSKNPRVISIPTIKDRIVLYVLKEMLHRLFPECISNELINVKIKKLFDIVSKTKSGFIFKIDIKGFYDSINQKILLAKLREKTNSVLFMTLVENAIVNPTVPKFYSKQARNSFSQYSGIPQGLAISNILANIYLLDFDNYISLKCNYYIRYVDDIFLICDENDKEYLYTEIKNILKRLNLEMNTDKTNIFKVADPFNFLGYRINKNNISVRQESIQNHINSIFAMLNIYRDLYNNKIPRDNWLTEGLLKNRIESEINLKITGAISQKKKYGWLFYFSAINDLSILYKLNLIVKNAIRRILPDIADKILLKSYIKAYHEIKRNSKSQYIHNFDIYDTIEKKIDYLNYRGYLDGKRRYSADEIEYLFSIIREKNLAKMQKDLSSLS